MAADYIFAYGAEMNRSDLRSWLERNGFDSSLVLTWALAALDGSDYVWNFYSSGRNGGAANLEPKEKAVVWGLLLEFEDSLLRAFDRMQGHPVFYNRGDKRVRVKRASDGEMIAAWVYTARPNKQGRRDVWPSRAYKKIILEAAAENAFPEEAAQAIRSWPTRD
jgi:gamma-glutamylcyclotransferase (GGCT)/AIG2-like uncharacterized protein YtfP